MQIKHIIKNIVIFSIFVGLIMGCTDIYEPEINIKESYLVVEGLITNEEGPHKVILSKTNEFGNDDNTGFVSDAKLRIEDNNKNKIYLDEKERGHYYTPDDFSGQIGDTYILHIETDDGIIYESEPQKLVQPADIDSVFGEFDSKIILIESSGSDQIYQREIDGVNMFINVSHDDKPEPKIRFKSTLMLQYSERVGGGYGWYSAPIYQYCWVKRDITDFLDSDIGKGFGNYVSERNNIAFFPTLNESLTHLGFSRDVPYQSPRIILKRVYTLNEESYTFHHERNKQLGDEGSFFDPISPQLEGNVHSVNDSEKKVLGFFEASSVTKETISVSVRSSDNTVNINTIDCYEHVSESGCLLEEFPEWWI